MANDCYAFPAFGVDGPVEYGMTLRDYFAGQALAGICAFGPYRTSAPQEAYKIADAMLAEREKRYV